MAGFFMFLLKLLVKVVVCVYTSGVRASDVAYESLRQDIVEWRLSPGDILAEVELSEHLGVSRTPVREAIARLVADGLAVAQRGRGTVVSEVSSDHLDDLFNLRRVLECEAARLAATEAARTGQHQTSQAFTALAEKFRATMENYPSVAPTDDYYALVAALDRSIDRAADNEYLTTALQNLRVHLQRIRRLAQDDPDRLRQAAREHASIATAIAEGAPDVAVAATTIHLHQSLKHIMEGLHNND